MSCEHCGYRRAMRGYIVCKKCLREFTLTAEKLKQLKETT